MQARLTRRIPLWRSPAYKAATMVISTLYLPGTAANIQYQYAPTRSVWLVTRNVQP
jgi:hypothetical protein